MFSLHIDTALGWRGTERQVADTVMALRASGGRAVLVCDPNGLLRRRFGEGLDLVPLPHHADVDLGAAFALSRVIGASPPDVIHAHDSPAIALAATALAMAAPARKPPLIASRRSELRPDRSSFSRWTYTQVDWFIAASEAIRRRLVDTGASPARVVVIPPGIDVDRVAATPPVNIHAELYLPTHAPVVGNVAALVPRKGHLHLLRAAADVVKSVPDARFVIIGDGELRAHLERQIHHDHLERHLFVTGFREDVVEMIRGVDVYVSAALVEGGSTAILDAMAAGKPVVATAVGNVQEMVVDGETGFVVAPGADAALGAAIMTLLRDEGVRRRMGEAGRALAGTRFSITRMTEQIEEIYAKACGG